MIVAKVINYNKHREIINTLLKDEDIKEQNLENDVIYGLEENNEMIGICKISILSTYCILEYIVIAKTKRGSNYGEYLLRSVINYCELKDIREIYYLGSNEYLLKKGFSIIDEECTAVAIKDLVKYERVLACEVKNYFQRCCRG